MKLDLVEINRLSPPGLWDLGILASVIAMLRGAIVGGHGSVFVYGRMVVRYSESLREKTRDNLNMRIKAWVMQCPIRTAHVRHIIGASAIKNWRKNRLLDYALTRYFGDWKRKFPDGFSHGEAKPRRHFTPKFTPQTRAYKWKLFALVKIVNVQGFLYRKPSPSTEEQDLRDAYYKLWGVDIGDDETARKWTQLHWRQPRSARTLNPIRFTPYELELAPEEQAETAPSFVITQDAPKRIEGETSSTEKSDELPPHKKPP